MSDLDKLREIYLTDVDEETKADNLAQIREWEQALTSNEAYQGWKDHDITRSISAEAKKAFVDTGLTLATRRNLTDAERQSLYARQDAMQWLLSLTERDAEAAIAQIEADIQRALNA